MGSDEDKGHNVDLTIVGGQPNQNRRPRRGRGVEVPAGLTMVLYLASKDDEFRDELLADRTAAIEAAGIQLRPSELATFEAISDEALDGMIDRLDPDHGHRRTMMKNIAAAVTTLAAGTASAAGVVACDEGSAGQGGSGASSSTTTSTTSTTTTTTTTVDDGPGGFQSGGCTAGDYPYGGWGGVGGTGGAGGVGGTGQGGAGGTGGT